MTSHVEQAVAERIAAARRKAEEKKRIREELAAARTAGLARRNARRLRNQGQTPKEGFGVRVYRKHRCEAVHSSWSEFAACVWPAAEVAGDGPYAAVSCAARTVTLYGVLAVALARKRAHDRDGCGPDCARRHQVIALDPGPERTGAAA
ncbi:hypothetical protein [Streptomyces mirabilis]|uniref:Uncharacterized protein n=1 Tax=Streptomyces mirabilis TaxID=68239 RepID=A0ABU3UWB4_9ACTN|nr:hypothetical protein [Streptomyces mirabilis]MDU8998197.1 hypothetical protein [Streptomyces mirabilis]